MKKYQEIIKKSEEDKSPKLDLSNSGLSVFPEEILKLKHLTKLVLRKNDLQNIPKNISVLENLEYLDVSQNNLVEIPIEVSSLPKLKTFIYDKNPLDTKSIFNNYGLVEIYLQLVSKKTHRIEFEIPELFQNAVKQYFMLFDVYVNSTKGIDLLFEVKTKDANLVLEMEVPEGVKTEQLESYLSEYVGFLAKQQVDIEEKYIISSLFQEMEFLKIKLETQINHFKQNISVLKLENKLLGEDKKFYIGLISESLQISKDIQSNAVKRIDSRYQESKQLVGSKINFLESQVKDLSNFNKYLQEISLNLSKSQINFNQKIETKALSQSSAIVNIHLGEKIKSAQESWNDIRDLLNEKKISTSQEDKELNEIQDILDDYSKESTKEELRNNNRLKNKIQRTLRKFIDKIKDTKTLIIDAPQVASKLILGFESIKGLFLQVGDSETVKIITLLLKILKGML